MQTKSKSFVKSNVNQVINRTAREPNCTIITVSIGKGFSHFLYLLTNKGCVSSLSGRSSSKMAKPVKTPNASEECFDVENDIHKFPFGTLFLFLFLTISIVLIFTPAREGLLSNGCLSGFSSHYFPKQKHTSIRSHPLFPYIGTD